MAHNQKAPEPESKGEGSPLWMVSFSDCMTLLMAFFLVLATFSSSGDKGQYEKSGSGSGKGDPSVMGGKAEGGAVVSKRPVPEQPEQGSETITPEALAGLISSGGKPNPKKAETYANKVFTIPSEKLFYGQSDMLTKEGKEILTIVGRYVQLVNTRIVISEGPPPPAGTRSVLARSLAILRFLVNNCGLDAGTMCVSISGTTPRTDDRRKAEIALLERSTYK